MASKVPTGLERVPLVAKVLAGVVLSVLVAAIYLILFFSEVDAAIAKEKRTETTLRKDLANAESAKEAYQKDLEEKSRKQQLVQEQKRVLPDEAETGAILSAIQEVANSAGIDLRAATPQGEVPDQFYAKVPMSLTLRGRYHQVARFFHGVGQLDRIINIQDIKIKVVKDTENNDEVILDVTCLATAFRSVKPVVAAAPAPPAPPPPEKK